MNARTNSSLTPGGCPRITRLLPARLLLMLIAASLSAQETPRTTPQTSSSDEKAVELSPFVVASDKDVGYVATNTLAGSRLNTALKDTPASISVFTEEFMKDIGAFSLDAV